MSERFEYEMFWDNESIGRLVNAEPDAPYVEGEWTSKGSATALRFDARLKEVFDTTSSVNREEGLQIELLHSNGHRSRGYLTGVDGGILFIRW